MSGALEVVILPSFLPYSAYILCKCNMLKVKTIDTYAVRWRYSLEMTRPEVVRKEEAWNPSRQDGTIVTAAQD